MDKSTPRPEAWQYGIEISWSDELPHCFLATVPDIPGVGAVGNTRAEAAKEADDAIEAALNACEAAGNPYPKPGSSLSAHRACVEALMQLRGNINDGALTPDQTMIAVLIDRKLAARVNAALAALEALEKGEGK